MKWRDFLKALADAEGKMVCIIRDLPHYEAFLKKTKLVVTYNNKQIDLKKEMSVFFFIDHQNFLQSQS